MSSKEVVSGEFTPGSFMRQSALFPPLVEGPGSKY